MSPRSTTSAIGRPRRYLTHTSHLALAIGCATLLAVVLSTAARANDWIGTISTDWYTAGNWDLNAIPISTDPVFFNTTTGIPSLINGGMVTVNGLYIGVGDKGVLTVANGAVLNSNLAYVGQMAGSSGAVTVTGVGSIWNAQGLVVGNDGVGTLAVLNGGAVNTSVYEFSLADQSGNGTAIVDGAGSKLTASDFVVGNGGTGTLTVSNGGAVIGTTWISTIGHDVGAVGTVTVTGAGSTLSNVGDLFIGQNGSGTLTVANGGGVTVGGNIVLAYQPGSTGTLNIGGAAGAAAAAPGTVNSANIEFRAGTGAINFNHTGVGYVFAPAMSGFGTINQLSGETILTADSSAFTGATSVTGGRLAVNGSLAGSIVTVSGGGILGGTGTVGGIVANSGGIVGAGNSIGTLNVNGNVSFAAGSIYQVETNAAGQSDKIAATGSATLNGGTVVASGAALMGTKYTILTAAGGINGTFASASASGVTVTPFLAYGLTYDATNVYLGVSRSNVTFASVGSTRNQIAAGGGADSLPVGSPLVGALVQLDVAQARGAFDQISGEVHASVKGVMIEDSRFLREAAIDRLRAAFDGVGAAAAPVTTYVNGRPVLAPAATDGIAVWGRGFGSWGQWNGDGNAATVKRDIGGFMVGADAPFVDGWRVGAIGGYSRSSFRVGDRNSSGASDNYHGGLYGGTQWGDLAFRSGLAYTRHDLSINRSVGFPGVAELLRNNYSAGTTQTFGEFGYRIRAGRTPLGHLAFEPFANLAYVNLSTDGFTEKGGAAALTGRNDTTGVTFTTLGLRASTGFDLGNGMTATARGMLGWRHAFGDVTPTSTMAFAGGSPFTVAGVPIARNGAVADLGLDVNVTPDAVLGLTYGGQFGSGVTDQTLRGNFAVRF